MRRLLVKIFSLMIVVIFSLIAINYIVPKNENSYYYAFKDKNELLNKDTNKKRIIFVGGSNLAFGLNSNLIEKNFDYDVVNMGLNAGLGLKLMVNNVKPYIKSGDIVVIAPEYEHFKGSLNGNVTINSLINLIPSSIKLLDLEQLLVVIKGIPDFYNSQIIVGIKSLLNKVNIDDIYRRDGFNEDGDLVSHLNKAGKKIQASKGETFEIDDEAIDFLNDFYDYATEKGVQVYMTYPSLFSEQYDYIRDDVDNLTNILTKKLNISIISNADDYAFEEDEIFDSAYHLNAKGRELRTENIIKDLEKVIN